MHEKSSADFFEFIAIYVRQEIAELSRLAIVNIQFQRKAANLFNE
jgi:hypothetical protein